MATRVVSYSELDALRQCPLKRHLAYTERWVMPDKSPALEKGSLWHKVLETHYNALKEPALVTELGAKAVAAYIAQADASEELKELVTWMYQGYLDTYEGDGAWTILGVELPFEEWLYNKKGNRTHFRLKGKIDLLVKDASSGGGLWIVDHKSCKNLPKGRQYDFDDQFGLYVWGLKQRGMDIRGVIHNACRTEKLKTREMNSEERFARHLTIRSDAELETMALEVLAEFEEGNLRGPQKGNLPRRRPDPDRCGWRCSYTEACLMSRAGGDIRELLTDLGGIVDPRRH